MLSADAVIENNGLLNGGAGGRGGLNSGGGDGGSGIEMLLGGKIINAEAGVISGGSGGIGRYNPSSLTTPVPITPGKGGNGVNGADIVVINAGTISAGSGGTGSGWTPQSGVAVHFTGGVNALELWSTSAINGLVLADGKDDRFILGGVVDGIFDTGAIGSGQQYDGFEAFEKTGAAVWTLNGSTNAITPWVVSEGIFPSQAMIV